MKSEKNTKPASVIAPSKKEVERASPENMKLFEPFSVLEQGIISALETYSNVHRGSGYNSMVSTQLYEQAREIVLEYLGLDRGSFVVIFCTLRRAATLTKQLKKDTYHIVSDMDFGLSLGVKAMAVRKNALPKGAPFQAGGGTTKLIAQKWVVWADTPDKFEAGTPAIVNVIAFARALHMTMKYGKNIFKNIDTEKRTVKDILYRDELEGFQGEELLEKLRETYIGRDVHVPTMEGNKRYINLDNSASTPTFTSIWDTFRQTLQQPPQMQQEVIREVRSICAGFLGAPSSDYEVIFTSNTTESINLVAENLSIEPGEGYEPVVLNTLLEHSSNDLPWRILPHHSLIRLSVDQDGFMDLNELETLLQAYNKDGKFGKKRIRLVTVSGASNVLGVCNDMVEINRIVHKYGARLLVDTAQLVAHRKVDIEDWGADYLAFSAHKVYAPFGTGVLVVRKDLLNFEAAELEQIHRSGEGNPGGIAALGKSFLLMQRIGMDVIIKDEQALTKQALQALSSISGIRLHGIKDPDAPMFEHKLGVIVFDFKNKMSDKVARELSIQGGIGVRFGCHCAHIIIKRMLKINPFLEWFQRLIVTFFPKVQLPGLTRISFGIENTLGDVDTLIDVLQKNAMPQKKSGKTKASSDSSLKPSFSEAEVKKQQEDLFNTISRKVYS